MVATSGLPNLASSQLGAQCQTFPSVPTAPSPLANSFFENASAASPSTPWTFYYTSPNDYLQQLYSNQQRIQLPSQTFGVASARLPFPHSQSFPSQMGTQPQMNAPDLLMNQVAGLAGTYSAQMAGLAAGYGGYNTALGGLPSASGNQSSHQLNASLSGWQSGWNQVPGQRAAAEATRVETGPPSQPTAMAQSLSGQRAIIDASSANALVQKYIAEQQAAALLKAQQAAVGINLANAPPAQVQQLKQAQQTGLASADVIRFLQAQNRALAQAPAAAPHQTVATDSAQVELARQLASATPREQKQLLGEKLYPLIHEIHARTLFFTNALFFSVLNALFNSFVLYSSYR